MAGKIKGKGNAGRGPRVLILMGSASDAEAMSGCARVLADFGIEYEMTVASAHRSPARSVKFAEAAAGRGVKVVVAAAGMAAHLAGVVSAHTDLPVLGVPMAGSSLGGLDALLSTVQMPPGVPVGTMGIGSAGAANAGHLAVRILALSDPVLAKKITDHKRKMAASVEQAAENLEKAKT